MAEYQAKLSNTLTFELKKEEQLVGKLIYQSWFKFNAVLEITNSSSYRIEPKGFWGTTIELKDGEKVLLHFSMNWSGEVVVQTYFNELERDYIFKHRGIFKDSFVLIDQDGVELIVMKPQVKWSIMDYEYQITTAEVFESLPNKEILLLNSLHCANYYLSIMMSQ